MVLLRILVFCSLAATAPAGEDAATTLRRLQGLPPQTGPAALDFAWRYLDSSEAVVRDAARKIIQAQPIATWRARALEEKNTWASLEILRALAESCPRAEASELSPHLCEQITTLRIEQMDEPQLLAAQRLTRLVFEKLGPLSEDERQQMLDLWSGLPSPSSAPVAKDRQALIEFLRSARPRRS